ncbi:hypothetical protein [Telluribacter sp.]|jgi:hypothetical protein|uniref:hypothetical protein n=1 Tax=Telluribacter sp. TaxID=1978767 RepID=UPI002E13F67A|nr:hypothetical protein [Telluribacter sp.]
MKTFNYAVAYTFLVVFLFILPVQAQSVGELTVQGTEIWKDGKPFPFTGISFFNAIYNPTFNKDRVERKKWLEKFDRYGLNVLRIWGQWDNKLGFVDTCPGCTLYNPDGSLRPEHLTTLKTIIREAAEQNMVIELALFARESYNENIRLGQPEADRAVKTLTQELLPYRNVVFQVWNENSVRVIDHLKIIKSVDPKRLVTNSPGYGGDLGDDKQNQALDFLTPHSSRQNVGRHWEIVPLEIKYLQQRFKKPVVDDEPARNGTAEFGGPKETPSPFDQILQIFQVWQAGGYIVYHHDMFQKGYGHPSVPPSGIPDPEHNPYHRTVLEFISKRPRYQH